MSYQDKNTLLDALYHVDPDPYQEWIRCGMALKNEGFPCSTWDEWSRRSGKYKAGDCEKHWDSFHGSGDPVTAGTIFEYAKNAGWTFPESGSQGKAMGWNDPVGDPGDKDPAEGKQEAAHVEEKQEPENHPGLYNDIINGGMEHVDLVADYMASRGITKKTMEHFHVGGTDSYYFKVTKQRMPAVIFPYSSDNSYYIARNMEPDKENRAFDKPLEKEAGPEPIYNGSVLYTSTQPVWIVEGPVDCMSIYQAGCAAVALVTSSATRAINAIKKKLPLAPVIICLDKDPRDEKGRATGQDEQKKLLAELDAMKVPYLVADFDYEGYDLRHGDPNDLLMNNAQKFYAEVKRITDKASKIEMDPGARDVDIFLQEIYTEKYMPVATGIDALDELLHGGLIPQTITLLGAEPGAGKTTLTSQVFETMAASGRRVLFFNLEMSRQQLLARSISRMAYTQKNWNISSLEVLQGYKQTEVNRSVVEEMASEYKRTIAKNLQYNPGSTGTDLDAILEYLDKTGKEANAAGLSGPDIVLDYLQILTGKGEDAAGLIKKAMAGLKDYATKYNAICFCIMAQGRGVNAAGKPTMAAGRDTSALEYGCDLQMQLVHAEDVDDPCQLELYVTKSRFTQSDMMHHINFYLHGGNSYMEECGMADRNGNPAFTGAYSDVSIQ